MSLTLRRIVIATHNPHKTDEFRGLLGGSWQVEDLTSHPSLPVPEETGQTFAENAAIKARSAGAWLGPGVLVVADDSGLVIDALDGRPGIYSARYAGPGAGDAANRERVMQEMAAVPPGNRSARFCCVLAVAEGDAVTASFEGFVEGHIGMVPAGTGGFGYDSLFIPDGYPATFGELTSAVKQSLSHRARALQALTEWLQEAELTK